MQPLTSLKRDPLTGMYITRCSPDCPFEECVILVKDPPPQGGEKEKDNEQDNSRDTDSSQSDSDNQNSESNDSDSETEPEDSQDSNSADNKGGSSSPTNESKIEHSDGDKPEKQQDSDKPTGDSSKKQPPKKPSPKEDDRSDGKPQEKPRPTEVIEKYESVFDPSKPLEELITGWGAVERKEAIRKPTSTMFREEVMTDKVFQARLKSVMHDNAYDRRVRGRKRGKLDMRSLYKVPAKVENIFTLKEARKNKHYNILLLVDESGSMDGAKAQTAAECAVFLAKSFEGINVNVAIVGFNHFITTRKTFTGEADYNIIYENIRTMNHGSGSGSNNDWDALNKAYSMFKTAPEGQNILIMLSDGQPASSGSPRFVDIHGKEEKAPIGTGTLQPVERNAKDHLHHLVKTHDYNVTSVGIGIYSGGWQIPNHQVVNNLSGLKPAIIGELRKNIKRG